MANRDLYRGTWFIESLVQVFMDQAWDMDIKDMLDLVGTRLKGYESEYGTKQTFEYTGKTSTDVILLYLEGNGTASTTFKRIFFSHGFQIHNSTGHMTLWYHPEDNAFTLDLLPVREST